MSTIFTDYDGNLELVDQKYYILKHVPQECSILDFAKTIEGVTYKSTQIWIRVWILRVY